MRARPALMPSGRRYLAALLGLMLLAPSLGMLVWPRQDRSMLEHRFLAPPPRWPASLGEALDFPASVDAYVRDHTAAREPLIFADLWLDARARLKPAGASSRAVLRGNEGWLLLEAGLLGATGGETDAKSARRYAAFACGLAADMKARRIPFVFVPIPGPAEVYPEAVPDWVPKGPVNQPQLVLNAARACGAEPLDLRPAMAAAKAPTGRWGLLYQHQDSHWTNIGALVAFDAIARRLGRPSWVIAPEDMQWRQQRATDQDLVRLSGLVDLAPERLPEPPEGPDSRPLNYSISGLNHGEHPAPLLLPGKGPIVLIIGDSYMSDFMPQYFRRAGLRLAWAHQGECRFDRRIFDRIRPDYVILAPAARLEACR